MRFYLKILFLIALFFISLIPARADNLQKHFIYRVKKIDCNLKVDGLWRKQVWQGAKTVKMKNFLGDIPEFKPIAKFKVLYDDNNIYVIFQVTERGVSCSQKEINGRVWEDSCVEFFFSPDSSETNHYFNLEINCCKSVLFRYNINPRIDFRYISVEDINEIEIANTIIGKIDDENIRKKVKWTIECRIPMEILRKYSTVIQPEKGTKWKGNFYNISEKGKYPHWISWTLIDNGKIDFHVPQYFGTIYFE